MCVHDRPRKAEAWATAAAATVGLLGYAGNHRGIAVAGGLTTLALALIRVRRHMEVSCQDGVDRSFLSGLSKLRSSLGFSPEPPTVGGHVVSFPSPSGSSPAHRSGSGR